MAMKWKLPRTIGQSLVESALLLPFISLLLIGIFEFGMLMYAHVQVANAAREAARAAAQYQQLRYNRTMNLSTPPSCTTIGSVAISGMSVQQVAQQAVVERSLQNGAKAGCPNATGTILNTSLGRLDASATWQLVISPDQTTNAGPSPGARATVTLTYPYSLLIVSNLFPYLVSPISISKSVNVEYAP